MPDKLFKYLGAGLLLASVFYLVIIGKVQPTEYLLLVGTALAALGINRVPGFVATPGLSSASPTPSPRISPSPTTAPATTTEGVKP